MCSLQVETFEGEHMDIDEIQREDELEKVRVTKWSMEFDNDDIEAEYVETVISPTMRTRIIPVAAALFAYSLYSLAFSEWFDSTPYITQWHTAANTLFNLSWIYHILSSIAIFAVSIIPTRIVRGQDFEIVSQIWLNIGIWVGVLFGNRWRCAKIFGYDPIEPFGNGLDDGALPYSSDADLLLILNGIVTYFCVWTPTRVRLSISLAISVCLSYSATGFILGLPDTDNPLTQSIMLIVLVSMVVSGKVHLERSIRQQFVAFNISVRRTKLLEVAVDTLRNANDGPTTNFEKAFADIGSALNLLETFNLGLQRDTGVGSTRRLGSSKASGILRRHSFTSDTERDSDQIIEATKLIRESFKILSRRTSIDRVVSHSSILFFCSLVSLRATSTRLEDITAKASDMLQTAGQDFNLNLIELQEIHLPDLPILPLIATQLISVLAAGALRIQEDILNNFLSRVSGTYTE
ncbi:Calcium/calmodulin-dependent 3',5'-cyclic nucleotide phosphodiesterase 1B, partial [Perkinsus olseni]